MKRNRIGGIVLSAAVCAQTVCTMPAEAAISETVFSLDAFAEQVQAIVQTDAERDIYETVVYDPAAGTLTADDGEALTDCGDLHVQDGVLTVDTGSGLLPFTEVPEANGYAASVNDGVVTLTNEFQTARLIVKAAGRIDTLGAKTAAEGYRDLHILQYETPAEAYAAYQVYSADRSVEFVQPSHQIVLDDPAATEGEAPAEKEYMTWGAELIGTEDFYTQYLQDAELPEVVVAVIDTGLNTVPSLFQDRILDGGINISNSGNDSMQDDFYHGTHVTGTICELTPENVKILPIKVFDKNGLASDEQIYLGLMYAVEQGADILNMSFGGLGVYPLEVEAMTVADEKGVICCAASGNDNQNAGYFYPGGIASCITVGAVDEEMNRATFSNYGDAVDVVAPGVNILSYVLGAEEEKAQKSGTSMATPHVSACCALLRSYDREMTPGRAEALLRLNAEDIGEPGFDSDFGWGLVSMKDFRWDDGICKAPSFSKKSGNFGGPQTVALKTDTQGAAIYYTTDGSLPDAENGTLYTEPLTITETTQVLAVSVKEGCVSSVPAEAVYCIGGKDVADAFTVENGVLLHCRSVLPEPAVPDTVTAVADGAFAGNHFVEKVTLPDAVSVLGARTFAGCTTLETLTACGVSEIGEEAFDGDTALRTLQLADNVTAAGAAAFRDCESLTQITLNGLTAVPAEMCKNCASLKTAMLPAAASFGDAAFSGCSSLKELKADWQNTTAVGEAAFADCMSWSGDLPFAKLETIGADAFSGDRSLMRVLLPAQITELPERAFAGCSGLRLLQMPGVAVLGESALAVGSIRSDLETEINWEQMTYVGANALRGIRIGNGYDTVTFSALETIEPESFAGVSAGALAFPLVQAVPENAFVKASVLAVYLEHASQLAADSVTGCRALVVTAEMTDIAPTAFAESTWIVSQDIISVPDDAPAYRSCAEPLVMRYSVLAQEVPAHTCAPCAVLACGTALTYQWYAVTESEQTPLSGETDYLLYPDTSETGTYSYLCEITDISGSKESVRFQVNVTAAEEYEAPEPGESCCKTGTDIRRVQIAVPADGLYRVIVSGAAPVTGFLTDASGKPVEILQATAQGMSALTAELHADTVYYLETTGKWDGSYTVRFSTDTEALHSIADYALTVTERQKPVYGTEYHPDITLTAPDGTVLQEGRDYTVKISQCNQNCTVSVFGCGQYTGYTESMLAIYPSVPEDTPIPVSLVNAADRAIYRYVPKKTGTYYFYATYAAGYAAEVDAYNLAGRFPSSAKCASIRATCTVTDQYDGSGTIFARNSYSAATGTYFNSSVTLYAGQSYYMVCTAGSAAEYALVISSEPPKNINKANISSSGYAVYEEGKKFIPKVKVKMDGEQLTEGVDYQVVNLNTDKPGQASLFIYGMGRYIGMVERNYEILYTDPPVPDEFTGIDETVAVNCGSGRIEAIWFRTETAETATETVRYRVINERVSGGVMNYQLYQYDPLSQTSAVVTPMKGEKDDYRLRNGIYCLVISKQYPGQACAAKFTVMQPYNLDETELIIEDSAYTGAPVPAPLKVMTPDGRELEPNRDYKISYPNDNVLFGTTQFNVVPTERSYGTNSGEYEIYVDLPEDAPELTIGAHTAFVTLEDRLAVYRLTAETDTEYLLASSDVPDIVLRVFSPEAEMLEQVHGTGAKALTFSVPAGEMRYIMVKFNGQNREGSIQFRLETETRLLSACETETVPQIWTGEQIPPQVVFRDGDYTLEEGVDYTLRYTTDDVNIGTATANYTGIGRYFGLCDVEYDIIAPDVLQIEDLQAVALMLGQVYNAEADEDEIYVLTSYTPGIQTDLKIRCYEPQCRLSMQIYREDGSFSESCHFRTEGTAEVSLEAGETVYILFAATDVSATNRRFKVLLTDTGNTDLKIVEDRDNGLYYRVSEERGYAEVYAIRGQSEQVFMKPEINGIPVSYVPEGIFTDFPKDTAVIGYAGCNAAQYADKYGFLYLEQSSESSTVAGDLNGDGRCSAADTVVLHALLSESELLIPELVQMQNADLNGDGCIDFADYGVLLASVVS